MDTNEFTKFSCYWGVGTVSACLYVYGNMGIVTSCRQQEYSCAATFGCRVWLRHCNKIKISR